MRDAFNTEHTYNIHIWSYWCNGTVIGLVSILMKHNNHTTLITLITGDEILHFKEWTTNNVIWLMCIKPWGKPKFDFLINVFYIVTLYNLI